jgi:hypothetical protein
MSATWQAWEVPEYYDPGRIADDLGDCRQRGLDWLDRKTSNQVPVPAVALQRLAEDYVAARRLAAAGRVTQIKLFLREGIEEFSQQGHTADAGLLRDLFFGDSMNGPIKPPGELLRTARERSGDSTEARFRERRTNVIRSFAQFLVTFAAPEPHGLDGATQDRIPVEHTQLATMGYVGDNEHFIQLLAEAVNVTIVGITNEHLAPMLQEALRRKRAAGRADAFWGSLRIVFLGETLLHAVNDEREVFHDSREALRQRLQEAVWARRSVQVTLKRTQSTRWALFDCPYLPTLTGTLFDFGDQQRRRIVHLLMKRPRQPSADHLYIELEDLEDQYFSALFEDIVRNSDPAVMIVPAGFPAGETFRCTEFRLHSNVLKDGSGANGWLPLILVVTSRRRGSHVEAMLQLRTEDNSSRELNRLSHLGGHITRGDLALPAGLSLVDAPTSFDCQQEIPMHTAARLVEEVIGVDPGSGLRPMGTGRYLHPDKEHLFFFIFALELPEGTQLPRRAEMHSFPLPELLAVRANQVLRSAAQLCQATEMQGRAWTGATEVVALNLYLHDYPELGEQMRGLAPHQGSGLAGMAAVIRQLVTERTSPSWVSAGREVQLMGLAGWQYREFFSALLPLYADIGIDGASDLLRLISADSRKSAAVERLAELYQDDYLMASVPLEL